MAILLQVYTLFGDFYEALTPIKFIQEVASHPQNNT